ncbi:MAG: M13 family metallopeptidase [Spirosomataceae bacterium]
MKHIIKTLLAPAISAVFLACGSEKSENQSTSFFDLSGMDTTASPTDDFFQYASGNWVKNTQIPADQTGWGSYYTLYEDNLAKLHEILKETAKGSHSPGSLEQKIGDYYTSGMDTVTIEKKGYEPIKADLVQIDALKTKQDIIDYSASLRSDPGSVWFGLYVGADDKNPGYNALQFGQAALSLPEKDYYFRTDEATKKVREAFKKYVATLFTLSGTDAVAAKQKAESILKLETEIAKSHRSQVELRDPEKNYNKYAIKDLIKLTPGIDWVGFTQKMGVKTDTILIGQPDYYKALDKVLGTQPIEVLKDRMRLSIVAGAASSLSKSFRDAQFEFYGKTLNGQQVEEARWKKITNAVDGGLGDLLGQLFVKKHFPPTAKIRMDELVNNLQTVYADRIKRLDWMSDSTKVEAIKKLNLYIKKIGYPDKWKDYADVTVVPDNYYANRQSIKASAIKRDFAKVGKAVDKTEWMLTAPTVNAYYNPTFNEIVFPAGILQFPFFDNAADDAINYGAIGAVIGHEMTHGFDDQGRQYNYMGMLKNWWAPTDADKFKRKALLVVKQYNNYTVLDNMHVNGELTLGENIADIGGLSIAYEAFKRTQQGQSTEKIDGFTPDQRFFLGFAQVWRIKNRDETMRMRVSVDPHSPERFRVNGPLSNMPEFYQAFGVKPTDKMYRPDSLRASIW